MGRIPGKRPRAPCRSEAARIALKKARLEPADIRYIFAGDLLGQLIATFFGMKELPAPLFGLYGACSTAGEALQLGAMTVNAGYASPCAVRGVQSFRQRRKTVPVSAGLRQSAAPVGHLDGDGLWCLVVGNTGR